MFIYILISFFASGLLYIAERSLLLQRRVLFSIFFVLSACCFCFVAGGRDYTVGADVSVYAQHAYNAALACDFSTYRDMTMFKEWGYFYLIYSWISARITSNFSAYLFMIELLIVIPVYCACHEYLKEKSYLGILVFGLVFFPSSLNMMRQAAAMGFVLLAIVKALRRKKGLYILFIIIAFLFHSSALIAIPIYPLVYLSRNHPFECLTLLSLLLLITLSAFDIISSFLGVGGSYSVYITGEYSALRGGTHPNLVFTACFVLGALLFVFLDRRKKGFPISSLLCLCIVGLFGMWLSVYSFYLYRIGFYYLYSFILLIPLCIKAMQQKAERNFILVTFVLLLLVVHVDYYMIVGSHDVLPYVMNWGK